VTRKIYRITSDASSIPVTVFATDSDTANQVFITYAMRHDVLRGANPYTIKGVTSEWLQNRPQLLAAAKQADDEEIDGVFYWMGHDRGWVAVAPDLSPPGAIAPNQSVVRAYTIETADDDASDAIVFAHDTEHARSIYREWHAKCFGTCDHPFAINLTSRWLLVGEMARLREQMDMGAVGIAVEIDDMAWHIIPPAVMPATM